MSIEQKIMQLQSDVIRLKKLVNYLLATGNEKEINTQGAYIFQFFAFQIENADGEEEWRYVGLALTATEIALNQNDSDNDLEFILVDILNKGIRKSEIPRNSDSSGGIDWSRFLKLSTFNSNSVTYINIYRPRTDFLNLVQERFVIYTINGTDESSFYVSDGYLKYDYIQNSGEEATAEVKMRTDNSSSFIPDFFENYIIEETSEETITTTNVIPTANVTITTTKNKYNLFINYLNTTFTINNLEYTSYSLFSYEYFDPDRSPNQFEYNYGPPSASSIFGANYYKSDDYLDFKVNA